MWILEIDVGRNGLIFQSQNHFHDARKSRRSFTMANVWFNLSCQSFGLDHLFGRKLTEPM
jgi:hypothetical protein